MLGSNSTAVSNSTRHNRVNKATQATSKVTEDLRALPTVSSPVTPTQTLLLEARRRVSVD